MKITKNKLLTGILTLAMPLAILMSAPSAQATDVKTYSGSMCEATFGFQAGDFYKYSGYTINQATSSRWLTCSVTRDRWFNVNGTYAAWINVSNPGGASTRCYMNEHRPDGSYVQQVTAAGSTWVGIDSSLSGNYGHRAVYCLVPAKGRVNHVRVYEHNAVD